MQTVQNILKLEKVVLIYSCILLSSICLFGCNKAEVIPAKTRHGANTFAFELDGRFVGGNFKSFNNKIDYQDSTIEILHFSNWNSLYYSIHRKLFLFLKYKDEPANYELENAAIYLSDFSNDTLYLNGSNYFEVTYFNAEKKIISGEFDLNFAKYDSVFVADSIWGNWEVNVTDSINLSKGRFDIRFD